MAKNPKTDIWMPVFIGDYAAETLHLNAAQHGGYFLLLMASWKAGGSLPDDDARLAATARMTADEWRQNRSILAEFFVVADGTWRHEELNKRLERASDNRQKRSESGSKGAAKRWQKDSSSTSSSSSEAKASGTDVAALVFGQGLDWLKQTSGKPDAACRALLGKWRKSLGSDEALIAILGRAQREGVIEPVGWIEKAIQARDPPSNPRDFN